MPRRFRLAFGLLSTYLVFLPLICQTACADPRTWIGGDGNWANNGLATLWTPNDEPDPNDEAIFSSDDEITMTTSNSIQGLTMSASSELFTNGQDLTIAGLVQLSGADTDLLVGGADSAVEADNVVINSGASLELRGGALNVDADGVGTLAINTGGLFAGNGELNFKDLPAINTSLLINDGTISALSRPLALLGVPPTGTLKIADSNAFGRVDLDGAAEGGVVNVQRNQTLDIRVPFSDAFSGTLNLSHNAKFEVTNAWTLDNGTISVNNGLADNLPPIPDVPASSSFIGGGTLTQSGGTINVLDSDGTLVFDNVFTMNGGNFVNNGLVEFNANATLAAGANFSRPSATSSITVGANATLNISQPNFDLDGANAATNVITISEGGAFTANVSDYDPDSATNAFNGTFNVNSGDVTFNSGDSEFVMAGILNMASTVAGQVTLWAGEAIDIGNDAGSLDSDLNVTGNQVSQFDAQVDFNADADVDIAEGATLVMNNTVNFSTVNGANNAQFTGKGTLRFDGVINVLEAVTLNMVGGSVDLDGGDTVGELVNIDAPLTVNAATMASFGRTNTSGTNTLDINNSAGTGVLTVNLDAAASEWTLNTEGVMNLVNDATQATLLAGSPVNLNGTVNVTGDVRIDARVDIGGPLAINTPGEPLTLNGGNNTNNPNTLAGGTISGPGVLSAGAGRALHGFGTINSNINFPATTALRADGGTLTINGILADVDVIGTADTDGILNVVNAWNTNIASSIDLQGGELKGGVITNDLAGGIVGHGLVSSRVINNQRINGEDETLILQTPGNDNDWDGATGTGRLVADAAGILELRDDATFGFTGSVTAVALSEVRTNGFALDFNPGSQLSLAGGKYRSTHTTDLGGTVSVSALGGTIQVENNSFLSFEATSQTSLAGDLQLLNNNIIIESGATFSGAGSLIVPEGSGMVIDTNSDVEVLLNMQGALRPSNSEGFGRIDLNDYQQSNTGELYVELAGKNLNQYDRLVVFGDAVIDGFLSIDIDGTWVPALGDKFNVISALNVTGEFDLVDISGMPTGLTFAVNYLPTAVQLEVVNKPIFAADFDDDGDVDATDLSYWNGAYDLNQLGDADGDNDSDGSDFLIWQQQFGSKPLAMAAIPVPEPASALLALGVVSTYIIGRRQRRNG